MRKTITIPLYPLTRSGVQKDREMFGGKYTLEMLKYLPQKPKWSLYSGDVSVRVDFGFKDMHAGNVPDIDNLLKPLFDFVKGSLFRDDRQVKAVRAFIHGGMVQPFIRVAVRDYVPVKVPPITLDI